MPLIVLSGIPCAGKSTRARQLVDYFTQRLTEQATPRKVVVFSDESLGICKAAYDAANQEKRARGQLMSAVERAVNRDDIVIADGLNYIKGFRYQLYCVARENSTTYCVIHVATPAEVAAEWNSARSASYAPPMMDNLISRFEEPDGRNRWDSPLFTSVYTDATLPLDDIWNAVMLRKAPPPNLATAVKPVTETNYLYELDKITQDVINAVLKAQQENLCDTLTVPHTDIKFDLPARTVSLMELRRIRRQFISINRMHVLLGAERIAGQFTEYLRTAFY
ncbi:kti12, chromatin associated [Tieghemiomyces parasiticus]|uniref:Kti12, chromatin associated n=1 Tax=Tieghemiomyces parasiticus TaxID=78921 RepID=A0A9W8AEI2_9FUNG|nr:kti12, chromatin associated [Tieghemiomyces parasiticus]